MFFRSLILLSVCNLPRVNMKIDTFTLVCAVLLVVLFVCAFGSGTCRMRCTTSESYGKTDFSDYQQMTHLPWAAPPTGIGALGEYELKQVQAMYPGLKFPTGKVPVSCPAPGCPQDGVRIYETGNALNPNVQSYIGFIQPDEITY